MEIESTAEERLSRRLALARSIPPPKQRRQLRERVGVSRALCAEVLRVDPSTLRSWETGRSEPQGDRRVRYAELLERLAAEIARAGT